MTQSDEPVDIDQVGQAIDDARAAKDHLLEVDPDAILHDEHESPGEPPVGGEDGEAQAAGEDGDAQAAGNLAAEDPSEQAPAEDPHGA